MFVLAAEDQRKGSSLHTVTAFLAIWAQRYGACEPKPLAGLKIRMIEMSFSGAYMTHMKGYRYHLNKWNGYVRVISALAQ